MDTFLTHDPFNIKYINRFWSKVRKQEGACWIWLGTPNRAGYGIYSTGGKKRLRHLAHRYSYRLFTGELREDLHILHKCDNPRCVNPLHLFLGNQSDNMKDMKEKNRGHKSNFSKDFIDQILRELTTGDSQRVIAARHFISPASVSFIKNNKINLKEG